MRERESPKKLLLFSWDYYAYHCCFYYYYTFFFLFFLRPTFFSLLFLLPRTFFFGKWRHILAQFFFEKKSFFLVKRNIREEMVYGSKEFFGATFL